VDGDVAMAESGMKGLSLEKAKTQEMHRSENVYLFQFPPVLPSLVPVSVKPDPEAEPNEDAMDVDVEKEKEEKDKKVEEKKNTPLNLPSGLVGKLRIHKSGKATLDWGGTPYILSMGADATFLQNVLIAEIPETKPVPDAPANATEAADAAKVKMEEEEKEKERAGAEPEAGLALGMGQVRGKFVLTPDWSEIL
jgi:DNA-directed RNA polymerase III subunit RPC4